MEVGTSWRGSKGPVSACRLNTNERSQLAVVSRLDGLSSHVLSEYNSVTKTSNGTEGAGEARCQSDKASPVFSFCNRNGNGLKMNV